MQEIEPRKKASPQRNALASVLRLQRKIIRTLNESMDELNQRRKSLWWSRWIPREEWSLQIYIVLFSSSSFVHPYRTSCGVEPDFTMKEIIWNLMKTCLESFELMSIHLRHGSQFCWTLFNVVLKLQRSIKHAMPFSLVEKNKLARNLCHMPWGSNGQLWRIT